MASRPKMSHARAQGIGMVLLLVLPLAMSHAGELRPQLQRESDSVRKAKLLSLREAADLASIRNEAEIGHFAEAMRQLIEYRDHVRAAQKALEDTGIDAEKRPAGFKQLQIAVRESIRRLEDIVAILPVSAREPFESVRRDLERVNKQLIIDLFPRQPGRQSKEQKTKP